MTSQELNGFNTPEQDPATKTINQLLPHYYEVYGDNPKYETVRSLPIDGHDVAWMEYSGEVIYDLSGQGREGETYCGHCLKCACDFTEGIGWKVEDGKRYNLDGEKKCLPRKAATFLCQLELRREYLDRFESDDPFKEGTYGLRDKMPEIILDLIEKEKDGRFIGEDSGGAQFWGGHFYLQTVEAITEMPMHDLWEVASKMVKDKQIQLEGAVIQSYFEPPAPRWEEYARFEFEGWIGVVALPTHSKMAQECRFTILDEEGKEVDVELPGEKLSYTPIFGPDIEDIAVAETRIKSMISVIKAAYQKKAQATLTDKDV